MNGLYKLCLCTLLITRWIPDVNAEETWKIQASPAIKKEYAKRRNMPCSIQRLIIGPDGEPMNATGGGNASTSQSGVTGGSPASMSKIKIEDLVIDNFCKDEENRAFMECVLDYNPNITEGDPGYNQGKCMCYRDWSVNSERSPAYNHSLDYRKESHEWFVFSEKHTECVIKIRKRCAPGSTLVVPYRCEEDGRCVDSDVDPHFMICAGAGKILAQMTMPQIANLIILLLNYSP